MQQIGITIVVLILFDIVYRVSTQRNRKYNYSPIYLRIEKIYDNWYLKNIGIINNHKASVIKIREVIFNLVKDLKKDGITKKDIAEYDNIINIVPSKNKWYTVVAGILTVISGNEIVKAIWGDLYKDLKKMKWANSQMLSLIIYFVLLIIVVFLFVRFSYILINSDNSRRDNMKIAIFKEVELLYEKEKVASDNTDLRSSFEIARNKAFEPIKFEWIQNLKKAFIELIEESNFLRSIFLLLLLLCAAVLFFLECEIYQLSRYVWQVWILFGVILILILILICLICNFIYEWYNYEKSNKRKCE